MANPFSRTLRSLEVDHFRFTLAGLLLTATLLVSWGVWFFLSEVSLYAVTDVARLEVDRESHSLSALVSGRVVGSRLELGRPVERGELLVELDSENIRLRIEEKRADKAGLAQELENVRRQIAAQARALRQARVAEIAAMEEARAEQEEAEVAARLAEKEAARLHRIQEQGLVSESESQRAAAEAEQSRAIARARRQSLKRLQADRRLEQSEKQALLAELERQAARLAASITSLQATLSRLRHGLEQHRVRAPVAGRLGEVVSLPVGTVIRAGQRLGAVIPSGEVKIVAEFAPSEAIGRIQPEQKARLRLEGFSWVQYGTIEAAVSRVATETQNGRIRVELRLDEPPSSLVPLQHGLPGTLEVEVERITPAALFLRAAGRTLFRPNRELAPLDDSP